MSVTDFIESFESRVMLSASAASRARTTHQPSVNDYVNLNARTLYVSGSSSRDRFDVRRDGKSVSIGMRIKVSGGGYFSDTVLYPLADFSRLVINGGRGRDEVSVDLSTQKLTTDWNVERRIIHVGKTRTITDIATASVPGTYSNSVDNWIERSAEQIKHADRGHADVALLGDSMMAFFAVTGVRSYKRLFTGHSAVDLGLQGDTSSQLLYRIREQGLLDGLTARTIVLNVGTNNLTLSDDPDGIKRGVFAVVAEIRQRMPGVKLLLAGILPRHDAHLDAVAVEVNQALATLDDGSSTRFVDGTEAFKNVNAGLKYYRADRLHLNARGYLVWSRLFKPVLDGLL